MTHDLGWPSSQSVSVIFALNSVQPVYWVHSEKGFENAETNSEVKVIISTKLQNININWEENALKILFLMHMHTAEPYVNTSAYYVITLQ